MTSIATRQLRHQIGRYAVGPVVHYRPQVRQYASNIPTKSRSRSSQPMGGVFEPFLKPDIGSNTDSINDNSPEQIKTLRVEDILPKDDQLKVIITNGAISMPIEKQKAVIQTILTALQQDQLPSTTYSSLLDLSGSKAADLTALGNVILRSSNGAALVALSLYECAMNAGDDSGAFSYANMLYRGHGGVTKDVERGIQILTDLARKGHPYAQMNLAVIVMRTKKDGGKTAVQLYELAGRGGLDMAWTELGRMYRTGLGVPQDHGKAVEYFQKGAKAGNAQCNFMLGVYASAPQADAAVDQVAAFKYFQKAAIKGMPEAQYNVGLRYFTGNGVEQNFVNAAEFYQMAATQGFPLAQSNLARMYYEGRGVKPNIEKAEQLWQNLAARGGPIGKDAAKCLRDLANSQGNRKKDDGKCAIM
ncbi:hypothetical protein BGW37DRAFT_503051 [Umbelopsis sp. PMI_123]|nr:hypothetical protein BGW37DRAFT_503051 [Umbelopsis sp. PMI_123]